MTALRTRRAFLRACLAGTTATAAVAGIGSASAPKNATTVRRADETPTDESPATSTDEPNTPIDPAGGDDPIGDVRYPGVDPARTGYAPGESGPTGPVKRWWCVRTPDRISPAIVVDGTVYAGADDGGLYALVGESTPTPEGSRGCRASEPTPTPTPSDANEDTDGDGAADANDYAPRDGSVRRRSDLAADDGRESDRFLAGFGLGAVATVFGAVVGRRFLRD